MLNYTEIHEAKVDEIHKRNYRRALNFVKRKAVIKHVLQRLIHPKVVKFFIEPAIVLGV